MNFGYSVGDIMAISGLAVKVYTAYKDAPGDYRNISDEVKSLDIIINNAAQHFKSSTLSDNKRREGQQVLRGCQNVLEDLDSLIVKYSSLASVSPSQAIKRIKLGTEDIATLRVRTISNTTLLNGFIQRFDIFTITIPYIMLISLYSCDSEKIQTQLNSVLGLRRTMSRDSIVSFTGNINTKKSYKKFYKGLFEAGVTAEIIAQKEKEIQDMLELANSNQIDGSTVDPNQLPEVGTSSDAETSRISATTSTKNLSSRSKFGWVRPPIDSLVGPLMLPAAETGNTKRLISILKYVRDINFADDNKATALHRAAANGHKDTVQLLLSKGALIEAMNSSNDPPLHLAARNGYTNIMELLLMNGASGEAMDKDYSPLLHCAASSGHTSTVELLLSKGAPIEARNSSHETALHCAALSGHTSMVGLLLSKGASIQATSYTWTPLHYAASSGHNGTVELLLLQGASIEAIDIYNRTPLHLAASSGHPGTVELLLSKGASIEAMSDIGTSLHCAASSGNTGAVELLLSKGASIASRNENNLTPLDLATQHHHTDTIDLLQNKVSEGRSETGHQLAGT